MAIHKYSTAQNHSEVLLDQQANTARPLRRELGCCKACHS